MGRRQGPVRQRRGPPHPNRASVRRPAKRPSEPARAARPVRTPWSDLRESADQAPGAPRPLPRRLPSRRTRPFRNVVEEPFGRALAGPLRSQSGPLLSPSKRREERPIEVAGALTVERTLHAVLRGPSGRRDRRAREFALEDCPDDLGRLRAHGRAKEESLHPPPAPPSSKGRWDRSRIVRVGLTVLRPNGSG
jgi:hypothetical protein